MNASFERAPKPFPVAEPLQLSAPESIVADAVTGEIQLSPSLHVCGIERTARSAQRRGFVVLQGGARFCTGMPTMRLVSFEQLEQSLPLIHLSADGRARVSVRDETEFASVTIELRMSSGGSSPTLG